MNSTTSEISQQGTQTTLDAQGFRQTHVNETLPVTIRLVDFDHVEINHPLYVRVGNSAASGESELVKVDDSGIASLDVAAADLSQGSLAIVVFDSHGREWTRQQLEIAQRTGDVTVQFGHDDGNDSISESNPHPLVSTEVREVFHLAAYSAAGNDHDAGNIDEWIDDRLGDLLQLNVLAESALAGDADAMVHINEILANTRNHYGENLSRDEIEDRLNSVLTRLEQRTVDEHPESAESVQTSPSFDEKMVLPQHAISTESLNSIILAAMVASADNESLGRLNFATAIKLFEKAETINRAYRAAMDAMRANLESRRAFGRLLDIRPIDPEPVPWPPKTKPWDPVTDSVGKPIVKKRYTVEELLKQAERLVFDADRFGCMYELLRETPFGFRSYTISGVSSNTVCPNETVTINGAGFGRAPGSVRVYARVYGRPTRVAVAPKTWSDSKIELVLPNNTISGPLSLSITWREVEVCGHRKQLKRAGNAVMMTVPELSTSLSIQRLKEERQGTPGTNTELYHITQNGKIDRRDIAQIVWRTSDAHLGTKVVTQNALGVETDISKSASGKLIFPVSGEVVPNETMKFVLQGKSRCTTQDKTIVAHGYHGIKASIEQFKASSVLVKPGENVVLNWSVKDAAGSLSVQAVELRTNKTYPLATTGNTTTVTVSENTKFILTAVGQERSQKRQDLVTTSKSLEVLTLPQVNAFSVNKSSVVYGDKIEFTFNTSGATRVYIADSVGNAVVSNLPNVGKYTLKMKDANAVAETYTLRAVNERMASTNPSRLAKSPSNITVDYRPSIEKFCLISKAVSSYPGKIPQPKVSEADNKQHIEVSYDLNSNSSVKIHQDCAVALRTRNTRYYKIWIDNALSTGGSSNVKLTIKGIQKKKYTVKFEAGSANGKVSGQGSVLYVDPVRQFSFCIIPRNLDGSLSTIHRTSEYFRARSKATAKNLARQKGLKRFGKRVYNGVERDAFEVREC